MRVVVISHSPFSCVTYNNVVSITVSGDNYIINDGTSHTYNKNSYRIAIM